MDWNSLLKTFNLTPLDAQMIPFGIVFFVAFWQVLKALLWKPYLALIEAREQATVGSENLAIKLTQDAAQAQARYEDEVLRARVAAMEKKLQLLSEAKKGADQITEKAEAEAQEQIRNARWETAHAVDKIRADLPKEAEKLAGEMIARVSSSAGATLALLITISLSSALLLTPGMLWAAGGAHHEPSVADLFWPAINFFLYIALMTYLLRRPLKEFLASRSAAVDAGVRAAQERRNQAESLYAQAQSKLTNLSREIEKLSQNIGAEGDREAQALVAQARDKAERIKVKARQTVEQEERAVAESLRRELAELAIERARAQLSGKLNVQSDQAFRNQALKSVNTLRG